MPRLRALGAGERQQRSDGFPRRTRRWRGLTRSRGPAPTVTGSWHPMSRRANLAQMGARGCLFVTVVAQCSDAHPDGSPVAWAGGTGVRSAARGGGQPGLSADARLLIAGQGVRATGYGPRADALWLPGDTVQWRPGWG